MSHFVPKVTSLTTRLAVQHEGTGPKNIQLNLVSAPEAAIVSSSPTTLAQPGEFLYIIDRPLQRPLSYTILHRQDMTCHKSNLLTPSKYDAVTSPGKPCLGEFATCKKIAVTLEGQQ